MRLSALPGHTKTDLLASRLESGCPRSLSVGPALVWGGQVSAYWRPDARAAAVNHNWGKLLAAKRALTIIAKFPDGTI